MQYDVWDYQTETWRVNYQVVCFLNTTVQIDLQRNEGWLAGEKEIVDFTRVQTPSLVVIIIFLIT